jgi:hypothetical protein
VGGGGSSGSVHLMNKWSNGAWCRPFSLTMKALQTQIKIQELVYVKRPN